jgi:hypothetical protein
VSSAFVFFFFFVSVAVSVNVLWRLQTVAIALIRSFDFDVFARGRAGVQQFANSHRLRRRDVRSSEPAEVPIASDRAVTI